ncbi:NAD-dependent epimerase/dehydratase family protein [Pontivivens insulae]|uniref:Uronate dehydrogenase n=1 Tax=Pontivivens insulae TaxID=1639689 RepID=A0A2R8AA47_9RHOB|nr:NAD(P)-dependent oxidoreductase [Pontivivens insulae]RED13010.1 nucleoside-diphosphate-sugar epimerase [Pontivivens insulae]SPF29102.1 Uronate dehydrogenase [Pontivivens insulae]
MTKRIFFTGGTGKAGRHVVPWLRDQGHHVVNADLKPLGCDGVDDLSIDITDSGQVFGALTQHANMGEFADGPAKPYDAVVHFAAVARVLLTSDAECFRVNTVGTYNVIEAAVKLGVKKIIIASSETVYGTCFAHGDLDPPGLPLTEDMATVPEDSYAMSKLCNEVTARSFQARSGIDIYVLRIGNVFEPHEYAEHFPDFFADPATRKRNIFNYIDARDLAQIVHRGVLTDGLGFQIFNAANDTNSVNRPAEELARTYFPNVPKGPLPGNTGLYSNEKVRRMLGFVEQHDWRRYVEG